MTNPDERQFVDEYAAVGEPELVIEIQTTTTTLTRKTMKLTGTMIRQLLDVAGFSVPDGASITVPVPGGGDWSNMDLDIDEDTAIEVTWTEQVTTLDQDAITHRTFDLLED